MQEFFIDVDKKLIKLLIEINHKTNIKTKTKMKVNVYNQNKNNLTGSYDYTSQSKLRVNTFSQNSSLQQYQSRQALKRNI